MVLAATFISVFLQSLGAWAGFAAVMGGISGFVAMLCGRDLDRIVREAALGAIAATPSGFLLFLGSAILLSTT